MIRSRQRLTENRLCLIAGGVFVFLLIFPAGCAGEAELAEMRPQATEVSAQRLADDERYVEALEAYAELLQQDPDNIEFYLARAEIYKKMGREESVHHEIEKVMPLIERNVREKANQPFVYPPKARAHALIGEWKAALDAIEYALAYVPDQAAWQAMKIHYELQIRLNPGGSSNKLSPRQQRLINRQ